MPPAKPNFLINVHLFRGLAIIPVVATHLLFEMHWPQELVWEFKICLSVVQNGTVPFVFVAGLLFQHRLASYRYATYLQSKLRYVVVPYVIASLPFVLLQHWRKFGMFAPSRPGSSNVWLDTTVTYLSGGQMAIPLWFIPMICTFYLLAPVFAFLDRKPKSYWLLPLLLGFASFAHRPALQPQLGHSILYFLPIYVTGMWVSHYREPVLAAAGRHRLALTALIVATVAFEVLMRERPGALESVSVFSTERGIFDVNLYQKLAASILALELLRHAGPMLCKVLDPVAEVSFGIFFTHYYFIYLGRDVLKEFGSSSWTGSAAAVVVMSLLVVTLCTLFAFGVRRLVGERSRYLIGC
jgi:probable poly-beta-1,6-N-acetyl-D-glucosamine export protein